MDSHMNFLTLFRRWSLIAFFGACSVHLHGEESGEDLHKTTWPKSLTVSVGGMSTEARGIAISCWHDPKSGYYLYKAVDCDWGHVSVTLTKDRRMVTNCGFEVARFGRKPENSPGMAVKHRKIELVTKNGIHIGMSREQVEQKLGRPNRTAARGKNKEYWCMLYKNVAMESSESGRVLRNTYIFKHDKLIEISINLDSVPGCCGDSLSDDKWPWSEF